MSKDKKEYSDDIGFNTSSVPCWWGLSFGVLKFHDAVIDPTYGDLLVYCSDKNGTEAQKL